jgi:hypothetical protein
MLNRLTFFIFSLTIAAELALGQSNGVASVGQCGGKGWTGVTVCAAGSTCTYQSSYYSLCTVNVNGQCGGVGYTGSTACAPGTICLFYDPYYSRCVPPEEMPPTTAATQKASAMTKSAPGASMNPSTP